VLIATGLIFDHLVNEVITLFKIKDRMKKFKSIIAIGLFTIVSTAALAQQATLTAEEKATKQTENMAIELGLTPEQKETIYAINLGVIQKNEAIRADMGMSSELKRQSIQGNNDARREMVMNVLTPQQKPKYEQLEKNQGLRMKSMNNQVVKPEIKE
jgi:hypothetical protein